MAFTNFDTKEINCKVAYLGPQGAGKTANLRSIFKATSAEVKSGLLDFNDRTQSTEFFDFLPISLGHVKDFHIKLHLFTVPFNPLFGNLPAVLLKGLDGFVFVADSRFEAMSDNFVALNDSRRRLLDHGFNISDMPRVIQYNKRDQPETLSTEILRAELNPTDLPDFEAVATQDTGTMETLKSLTEQVLRKIAP